MLFLQKKNAQQLHRSVAFKLGTGDETGNFYLHLLQDAKESKVIDCKTYNFAGRTGIAILTSNYHFYVANNVEEVRSRQYYDPPGK